MGRSFLQDAVKMEDLVVEDVMAVLGALDVLAVKGQIERG